MFWQAPLATETTFGEIAEIGYFVKWSETDRAVPRPVLCRFFVNPSKQDSSGAIIANSENFLIYKSMDSWLSGSLLGSVAPADKASGYVGLFAENVVGLWLRCTGLDGAELPKTFDSRKGYELTVKYTDASGMQTKKEQRYLPAAVTVSVAQIESRLTPRMDNVWDTLQRISRESKDAAISSSEYRLRRAPAALRPLSAGCEPTRLR